MVRRPDHRELATSGIEPSGLGVPTSRGFGGHSLSSSATRLLGATIRKASSTMAVTSSQSTLLGPVVSGRRRASSRTSPSPTELVQRIVRVRSPPVPPARQVGRGTTARSASRRGGRRGSSRVAACPERRSTARRDSSVRSHPAARGRSCGRGSAHVLPCPASLAPLHHSDRVHRFVHRLTWNAWTARTQSTTRGSPTNTNRRGGHGRRVRELLHGPLERGVKRP